MRPGGYLADTVCAFRIAKLLRYPLETGQYIKGGNDI